MLTLTMPLFSLLLLSLAAQSKFFWLISCISLLFLSLFTLVFKMPLTFSFMGDFLFFTDNLAFLLILITFWISALMIIASQKIIISKNEPVPFISFVLLLSLILVLAFSSSSFVVFYIFFEGSLIPTLLLILGWGYQPERLQAGMYLIMYTVTASLPLLISLLYLYKMNGHLSLIISDWLFFYPSFSFSSIWWLIMLAAFLVKTPLFLVHLWLPKAHVEAPVAGSMILAGILLKLGSYGLLRIGAKFMLFNKETLPIIMTISLMGGAFASFICVRQSDIKALIAYSSVSHMGLATAGIVSNTSWGWQGALLMLVAHGLCSACLFSLANMTYETINSRGMYITKGMMAFFPSLSFWWFCFSACNMAAPPSMNLAAEVLLISGTIAVSSITLLPLAIMAFMAAGYSLYLFTSTQHGVPTPFSNPLSLFTTRNYTICAAHFIPLIFMILKPEVLSMWL